MSSSYRFRYNLSMLLASICVFAFILGWCVIRHYLFLNSINDIGVFDQAVWGIVHGFGFLNTSMPYGGENSWLGFHFHIILAVFAPLYFLVETPHWFNLAQALCASVSFYLVYCIAMSLGVGRRESFFWSLIFIFNPFIFNAFLWDFHPVYLALPLCLLVYLGIFNGNLVLVLSGCLMLLLIKESMGLVVAGFGILILFDRKLLLGSVLVILGVGHFILVVAYLMPLFSPLGVHPMLADGQGQLSRFSWLGSDVKEVVSTVLFNPAYVLSFVLISLGAGKYLFALLFPVVFLPLIKIAWLLPFGGELIINSLSVNGMPRNMHAYHSLLISSGVIVASIMARIALRDVTSSSLLRFIIILVVFTTAGFWWVTNKDNYWGIDIQKLVVVNNSLQELKGLLPEDRLIRIQANLGGHLSSRKLVKPYKGEVKEGEIVVLLLESPTNRLEGRGPGDIGTLAHHLQMYPGDYLESVSDILRGPVRILFWQDNWLAFEVADRQVVDGPLLASVEQRLKALSLEWLGH